jgi:outer membrane protein OmpA-like peptidoglycan-associated protein
MAVKIERGGWVLIFLVGVALVGYSLNRYGVIDLSRWTGGKSSSSSGETVDASKPLLLPASSTSSDAEVRVRVNVWVGCVGGLVANGGLDTQTDSIYGKKGLKVSFKIIDDWTEGSSALATDNVDVMLTTADVYAKDYAQFKEKGFGSHAFVMVDWSRGADGVIGKQGINSFNQAIHTKDGIEPATLFAQEKVDAAVAWDPDMSDAVAKRPGSKKIYDTKIANRLIADILVVSDSFSAKHPQTLLKFAQGWLEGVEFIKTQPERAYNLIGTVKDFNIPSDLAKTMLGGVKLADYADNRSFMGTAGANSDYANILGMAQDMYRESMIIKHTFSPEESLDRRYVEKLADSFSMASSEAPIEYKEPPRGATPIATQHRSIYFDPNSSAMSLDSRAVVDELAGTMRAYENTIVDIDGNTDSTGARAYNIQLSHARADGVKNYLMQKYGFPSARLRTAGNGPDKPIDSNATPEGREKNRRTDIKVYANPSS